MKFNQAVLFIILLLLSKISFAQKESFNWYFGNKAGIKFTETTVAPMTNGQMSTDEGCATISDKDGNLLFYTDGITVWNKNHGVMATGLKGSQTSTQSAIIVPNPSGNDRFYIFTVDAIANGIQYSEVDMSLNGGLGDITAIKNIQLLTTALEKITAVIHDNKKDIWVIGHSKGTTAYYAYLISGSGVNPTPYISNMGSNTGPSVQGYMKFSSSGTRMAAAHYESPLRSVELFDFNKTTGKLSNFLKIDNLNNEQPYGIEFSPSGNFLYVLTGEGSLLQYDLTAADIPGSKLTITDFNTAAGNSGALQLAPNSKIYIAIKNAGSLSVIEKPNQLGTACQFVKNEQTLAGKTSMLGLPTFIQSYFRISAEFSFSNTCIGDTTQFVSHLEQYDSLLWNFDDPASGNLNSSKELNPKHFFQIKGFYQIKLTVFFNGFFKDFFQELNIYPYPVFDLGKDTTICEGSSVTITLPFTTDELRWTDGSKAVSRNIDSGGKYIAIVTQNGCVTKDTINIFVEPTPLITMPDSVVICGSSPAYAGTDALADFYSWNDGESTAKRWITTPGLYTLSVMKNGCTAQKDIIALSRIIPALELGNDTFLCDATGKIELGQAFPNVSYLWNNGATSPTISVSKSGNYSVNLSIADCPDIKDAIKVLFLKTPDEDSTTINACSEEQFKISATTPQSKYFWNTGDSAMAITPKESGLYEVVVTNSCGTDVAFFDVIIAECYCRGYVPNAVTLNNDELNEIFGPVMHCNMELTNYRFAIYDLWGGMVFESNIPGEKISLSPSTNTVYIWTLEYSTRKYQQNIQSTQRGTVTVLK